MGRVLAPSGETVVILLRDILTVQNIGYRERCYWSSDGFIHVVVFSTWTRNNVENGDDYSVSVKASRCWPKQK